MNVKEEFEAVKQRQEGLFKRLGEPIPPTKEPTIPVGWITMDEMMEMLDPWYIKLWKRLRG